MGEKVKITLMLFSFYVLFMYISRTLETRQYLEESKGVSDDILSNRKNKFTARSGTYSQLVASIHV